ncbi:MAG TPA: hypothetical protein VGN95_12525 [Pyrinomonadaceae bacterium]|nr:hypothetical protein [Pyrinomonadaceae bacterium]
MNYPLQLSFKLLALTRQVSVTDAQGNLIFYVKQKAFKLKDAVTVFADAEQTRPLYNINADKMMDFSARFHFTDQNGQQLGSVKRQGMKSIWKARYDILDGENPVMMIAEENPWTKVFDALLGELPIVGMFTGYLFNPSYQVTHTNGAVLMRLIKKPAFFESKFIVEKHAELPPAEETRAVLSLLMMIMLERRRG